MDHLALRRIPLYPSGNEISWNLLVKEYTLSNLYDNQEKKKEKSLDIAIFVASQETESFLKKRGTIERRDSITDEVIFEFRGRHGRLETWPFR